MKLRKILLTCLLLVFSLFVISCGEEETSYNIKFVDYDNTLLLEVNLEEGEMPIYSKANPSRESNAEYTYTFLGWDKIIEPAKEDVTYKAVYLERVNVYTVTFADEDGTVLQTMELQYGQMPMYTLKNPTKESNAQYTYRFDGWDKEVSAVTSNVTYVAKYAPLTNAYKVTFLDLKGNVLYEDNFDYGETPVYHGETPILEGNVQYSYEFNGWDKELAPVTGETTYRVQFKQVVNEYSVKFLNIEGEVIEEKKVPYGTTPVFEGTLPEIPIGDVQYSYIGRWDNELTPVTGEVSYHYVVDKVLNKYTVKFVNEDGTLLSEKQYDYGTTPVYELDIPTKENTTEFGYEFASWDKEITAVVGDITYKAVYNQVKAKYSIKFLDTEGNVVQEEMLEYGQTPQYKGKSLLPENTAAYSYVGNWDNEIVPVSGNATYNYIINKSLNKYDVTINHLNLDGTVLLDAYKTNLDYCSELLFKGYYTYTAPTVEGKVPSHDYVYYVVDGNVVINIYYSDVEKLTSSTVASISLAGSGTETDPYLIESAADFLYFQTNAANYSGKYLKMTKSIELEVENFKIDGTFAGILDGNNCSIRGINIIGTAAQTGLFNTVSGTIKNLSLYGKVTQTAEVSYTASLVGLLNKGHLYNITNYCTVDGHARVGGIIGWHKNGGSSINNCVNYGIITGENARVGGIIGHSSESAEIYVNNSINYGDVSGTSNVGGIVGYCQNSSQVYTGCVNYGTITAMTSYAGGITGYSSMKLIDSCINYGSIVSPTSGGIIGHSNAEAVVLVNCINYGPLSKVGVDPLIGKKDKAPASMDGCVNYYEPVETK